MTCAFCREGHNEFWRGVAAWERNHAFYWNLFDEEPDSDALLAAAKFRDADPELAFSKYQDLADEGSILALEMIAECYDRGRGVEADEEAAITYYIRAQQGGSWMGSLKYSHFFARREYWDNCLAILEDAVSAKIIPAYFWLAWRLHQHGTDKNGYLRIEQLLREAESEGHPAAKLYWSRHAVRGRFGVRNVIPGLKKLYQFFKQRMADVSDAEANGTETTP